MAKNRLDLSKLSRNFNKCKRLLPDIIGEDAVNFFLDNYRKGGFTDSSFKKWPGRKGGKDPGRALLVKSSRLRNSIRVQEKTATRVTVGTRGISYAKYHNEGRGVPQRKFIGDSKVLRNDIRKLITEELNLCIKKTFR